MIKKVVVAAAGRGTRMLSLTKKIPKHLIKIKTKPFLAYLLDNLLKAGYKDLIVVVGYKGEKIGEFLKEYEYKATVVDQFKILPKREYGTACPLKCVKGLIGKEDFLMVCGDNLYSIKDLKAFNIEDEYNYIAGFHHENPGKYGVLISDNDFLKEIVEKPKKNIGNLINTGLYKFTPEVFKKLSKIPLSPRGEYELTDLITLLAKEKKVKVKKIQDYWLDFGNPSDIIRLSRFLKTSKNFK
jgi:NDP-sugar pyrophosphorylase family protein